VKPEPPSIPEQREAATQAAITDPGVAADLRAGQYGRGFRRFLRVYHEHMPHDPKRERLFLASVGFVLMFIALRLLTHAIRNNIGPFRNVSFGGTHVHHLVWGILLLLLVGYLWLIEFGTRDPVSDLASRLSAIAYGVAAALTLDEFALWLNLKDVYWERQGRVSIDAAVVFTALLMVWVWGAPLMKALTKEAAVVAREWNALVRGAREIIHLEEEGEKNRPVPPKDDPPGS
jgi:hypothetical protein